MFIFYICKVTRRMKKEFTENKTRNQETYERVQNVELLWEKNLHREGEPNYSLRKHGRRHIPE